MQPMRRKALFGAMTLLLPMAALLRADDPQPQPPAKSKIAIEVYDVSDLLAPVEDYTLANSPRAAGFANGPDAAEPQGQQPTNTLFCGGDPAAVAKVNAAQARRDRVDQLVKDIQSTIATDTWREDGGPVGEIIEDNGTLIVRQTAEAQAQIKALLDKLAERKSLTVRVEADWVWLPAKDAQAWLDSAKRENAGGTALVEVKPGALAALPQGTRHIHAEIAGRNGQVVYVASGRTESVVSNVTPVVSTGVAAFAPTVSPVAGGAALQVRPTAKPDLGYAVLDANATFDELGELRQVRAGAVAGIAIDPWEGTHGSGTTHPAGPITVHLPVTTRPTASTVQSRFDTARMSLQDIHTTLRVPLGRPVLVGGGTWDPAGVSKQDSALLFVTVHAAK